MSGKLGKLVLLFCGIASWFLLASMGAGYFLCGLIQGCPYSQGRSFLAYAFEPLLGYDLGIKAAHLIDLTPFVCTLLIFVPAALVVKKRRVEIAVHKCDGCNASFPDPIT